MRPLFFRYCSDLCLRVELRLYGRRARLLAFTRCMFDPDLLAHGQL